MTRLVSLRGATVDAEPSAVARMVESGMFALAAGEVLPGPDPVDDPLPDPDPDPGPVFNAAAFGAPPEEEDLSGKTNADLAAIAEARGLAVPKRASKAQLLELLG